MGTLYPGVSVSGYNASPPADDGTQNAANQVLWATIKAKLPDPLKTAIESINTALVAAFDFSVTQKTGDYTTAAADHMRTVEVAPNVSSAVTISLGDAATMTAKYMVRIKNSGSSTVTVGRATSGNTIDGVAGNLTLASGQSVTLSTTSAADAYVTLASVNYSPGDHTFAGNLLVSGGAVTWGGNPTHSGNHIFSGTVSVNGKLTAGDELIITPGAGIQSPGAGEGHLASTTVDGLQVAGRGSTNDISFYNKNGSLVCNVPTGTANWRFGGFIASSVGTTGSIATNTPTTIFSAATAGRYEVTCYVVGAGAIYNAAGIVVSDGTLVELLQLTGIGDGSHTVLSLSGTNVQVKQVSGGAAIVSYSVLKIG